MMMTYALIGRIVITLLVLGILLRMLGKRGVGGLGPLDLLVAIVAGNLTSTMMLGLLPLPEGILALGAVLWLHTLVSVTLARKPWFTKPVVLVRNGRIQQQELARACLSRAQLDMLLHESGAERIHDIQELRLEQDGALILLRQPQAAAIIPGDITPTTDHTQEDASWRRAA